MRLSTIPTYKRFYSLKYTLTIFVCCFSKPWPSSLPSTGITVNVAPTDSPIGNSMSSGRDAYVERNSLSSRGNRIKTFDSDRLWVDSYSKRTHKVDGRGGLSQLYSPEAFNSVDTEATITDSQEPMFAALHHCDPKPETRRVFYTLASFLSENDG
ncbi:unnamed protein product [Protopolystoma xenopodis]|uniref:Uncharacterized protein n=1 Tax=Protopolystoma xenopodis TaxID=117903 RepID=A0A3S5FC75_9PLAT|nr:unnamed protein product [Protopolystoma xenopodis]